MPRPQSPEGAWVTIPVRVRQADLDRIDVARGGKNRSEWGRAAMLAALDGPPDPVAPVSVTVDEPVPAGSTVVAAPGQPLEVIPVAPKTTERPKRQRKAPEAAAPAGPLLTTAAELAKPAGQRTAAVIPGVSYPCCKHCKVQHYRGHGDPCANGCHS